MKHELKMLPLENNFRTGRILNILYLKLKNLLDSPILYLSRYINDNKQTYYKLFKEVRETNDFEEWIIYILIGIEETAEETMNLIKNNSPQYNWGDSYIFWTKRYYFVFGHFQV